MRWARAFNEPCRLPNQLEYKFETERLGCFKMSFSSSGRFLAAACTKQNSKTIIKVFDINNGTLEVQLKGHLDVIHDMDWSPDDNCLVTASADSTVRLWNMR